MKRTITTVLTLCVFAAGAQDNTRKGVVNMKGRLASKNQAGLKTEKPAAVYGPLNNAASLQKSAATTYNFNSFASSLNIYGVTTNCEKPLNYNHNVNAVSFIERKGPNFTGHPYDNSGVIVGMVSSNWGSTWDSTAIYSDNNNFARYPQGAIYSAPGNTNIANAYIVASGPVIDGGSSWSGNFFASKQIGTTGSAVFNTTASAVPGAQQFFSTAGPFGPNVFSNDFAQYGFASTDDGKVRSVGLLTPDPDAAPVLARGAVIQTGSFNSGTFTWVTDSLLPPVITISDGSLQMNTNAYMAWDVSGTIGYVVFIGSRTGATLSNRGWQPIVYKTTTGGASWTLLAGIDFNNSVFQPIKNRLDPVNGNASLVIPFFTPFEGIDCAVDSQGKLHIAAAIATTASNDNDSLAYTPAYGTEEYVWPHTAGKNAYLYDFVGDGTAAWTYLTVDSIATEAPAATSGYPGFSDNPWDDDQGKVTSDSRIQLSRTTDGKAIVYTWAESDPLLTIGGKFWNNIPNVKAKMWSNDPSFPVTLSATKINVTKPATNANPLVSSTAMFHFTAPNSGSQTVTTVASSNTVVVRTPFTVTNNNSLTQGIPNTHFFSATPLNFIFSLPTGIKENQKNEALFSLYPNPANQNCVVAIDLTESANLEVSVLNYLGQVVKQSQVKGQFGNNEIALDLTNVKSGIYFVNIKNGSFVSTKKLIVE